MTIHSSNDLLLFQDRIIIPPLGYKNVLNCIHEGLLGITKGQDKAKKLFVSDNRGQYSSDEFVELNRSRSSMAS